MQARIPNILAILRILLVPLIVYLLLESDGSIQTYYLAAILTLVASLTDLLDGYLARKWEVTSLQGAFLDTTADKLLVAGLLISLVAIDRASAWAVLIMIARELIVMGVRGMAAMEGTFISPSFWGKSKATLQFIAIIAAILRLGPEFAGMFLDEWLIWLATIAAILSGWDYVRGYLQGQSAS